MEKQKLPVWEFNDYKDVLSITVQKIYINDICCADKLSNCRAQLYDYNQIGNALFNRFNKESTPELQAWYYKSIMKALSPLKAWKMYTELCEVVKELYGE